MLLLVVVSLKSFCSRESSCTDDYCRWCGILFLSAYARLVAAVMNSSFGVTVGFVVYLFKKNTVPDTLGARFLLTQGFQHRYCSYNVPITYAFL